LPCGAAALFSSEEKEKRGGAAAATSPLLLLHCDSRSTSAAACAAQEANKRGVPVSVDVEKPRPGLEEELLPCADIIFTNSSFPFRMSNAGAATVPSPSRAADGSELSCEAVVAAHVEKIFSRYPRVRLVVSTLGERGAVATLRRGAGLSQIASGCLAARLVTTEGKGIASAGGDDLQEKEVGDDSCSGAARRLARTKLESGDITHDEYARIVEQSDELLAAEDDVVGDSNSAEGTAFEARGLPVHFERLPSFWRRVLSIDPAASEERAGGDGKPGQGGEEQQQQQQQQQQRLQFYDALRVTSWPVAQKAASARTSTSTSTNPSVPPRADALPSVVVDTTGAGDAFIGGCLVGITRGLPLQRALALGSFVASHKLRAHGARAGLPRAKAGEVPSALLGFGGWG
jgi:sugar/nucleoside kinase (ribokinase family)